jgi:predicted DNA-binding transcriptional regulator AlpA
MSEKLAYSVPEMAKALGLGLNIAYDLCNRDDFPAIRIGERRIIIPVDKLRIWLEIQAGKGGWSNNVG